MGFWTEFRDVVKIVVGVIAAYYGHWSFLIAAVSDIYGRDQRRQARRKAYASYKASLQDRYQMVRGGTEPRKMLYGRARISGPIVYAQSTGTKKEFLHLVIALAGHECDAIETIYFNDTALPAEDGSGFIQSGSYSRTDEIDAVETYSGTSKVLAHTPSSIVSVTKEGGSGDGIFSFTLANPADYTIAGATISTPGGGSIVVNYKWTQTTAKVRVKKFLGTSTQAASTDLVSESGGKWTSAHQLKGICYLYARLEFDQQVFGQSGLPNVSVILRGKKVYDPRLDTTVGGSGSHRIATPSTWAWSENSALCTSDFLRDASFGMAAATTDLPPSETITASNECDEMVPIYNTGTCNVVSGSPNVGLSTGAGIISKIRPGMYFIGPNAVAYKVLSVEPAFPRIVLEVNYGGSTLSTQAFTINEKRYTCNGVIDSGDASRNNLDKIVESMAGVAVWVQGRWLIRAGAHIAAVLTITEDWLADGAPVISPRAARQELFNKVLCTYAEKEKLYTDTQAPPVTNATYVTDDGGLELPVEMTYDMVTSGVFAQRLAKIHLERARQAMTVKLTCNLKAYDLNPSDVVAVTLTRYGWSAKLFEVVSRALDLNTWTVELMLRETASAVWDWALGAETAIDLTPNTDLPNPFTLPAAIAGLSAASGTAQLMKLPDGTIMTRALVTWTASTEVFVLQGGRIEIRWKRDDAADWTVEPSVPGDSTSAVFGPLDDLRVTIVQVRAVNSRDRFGPWTSFVFTSVGKTAAPANVSGLTATTLAQGVRISWSDNTEIDYESTELRYGASYAAGTRIFRGNASAYNWVNPAVGVYTVWAAHYDTTGNVSSTPASVSATVLYQGDVNASVDLVLTQRAGSGDYVQRGNSLEALVTVNGAFNDCEASTESYLGGAFASFSFPMGAGTYAIVGMTIDPTTNASGANWYGFIMRNTTSVEFRYAGNEVHVSTWAAGDVFSIRYEGNKIYVAVNGVVITALATPPGLRLYFGASSLQSGVFASNIRFGPLTAINPGSLPEQGQGGALNSDPSCSDLTAWSGPTGGVAVASITDGIAGLTCLRFTGGDQLVQTNPVMVGVGKFYRVSCWARKTTGTGAFYFRLRFINSSNALISETVGVENVTLGSSWVRYQGTVVAPATTVYAKGYVIANYVGPGGSGVTDVQDVRLEEAVDTQLIAPDAATLISTATASSISVTAQSHVPDGFAWNTTIVSAAVVPSPLDAGNVEVLVTATFNYTISAGASGEYLQFSLQKASSYTAGLRTSTSQVPASTTRIDTVVITRRFSVPGNVSETFGLYADKINTSTVTIDSAELRIEVVKR